MGGQQGRSGPKLSFLVSWMSCLAQVPYLHRRTAQSSHCHVAQTTTFYLSCRQYCAFASNWRQGLSKESHRSPNSFGYYGRYSSANVTRKVRTRWLVWPCLITQKRHSEANGDRPSPRSQLRLHANYLSDVVMVCSNYAWSVHPHHPNPQLVSI